MATKYQPLMDYLKKQAHSAKSLTLDFAEIERIIGTNLPKSAFQYREWWANQSDLSTRPQTKAWVHAGFVVDKVDARTTDGTVRFKRK